MIHLPASVRVYLCLTPCDMRNYAPSIDYAESRRTERRPGPFFETLDGA